MSEAAGPRTRAVGINHVALEVGDIDSALFEVRLRGRSDTMAFIDLGDQFIALSTGRRQGAGRASSPRARGRRRAPLRRALEALGATILPGRGLDFLDPWGNRVQVVEYRDIQFTKAPEVLRAMDLGDLAKSPAALEELANKGIRFE